MRKKEERDCAFEDNKIHDICMHKDRSHLYDVDVSSTEPVASFHAYQEMIQDQMLHENKWHDRHSSSLAKVPQDKVHESECLYF